MASGGTSLRFSVVVAADQAEQALKSLTTAFNQAGVSAKTSMAGIAPAARQAGAEVISLGDKMKAFAREQRSEARTAGFFVQELSAIVPMSGEIKSALGGIGAAIVGGAGLATAIGLAGTGVALLVKHFRDSEEAAEKTAAAIKKLATETREAIVQLNVLRAKRSGDEVGAARIGGLGGIAGAQEKYRDAQKALDEYIRAQGLLVDSNGRVIQATDLQFAELKKLNLALTKASADVKAAAIKSATEVTSVTKSEADKRTKIAEDEARKQTEAARKVLAAAHARDTSGQASVASFYDLEAGGYSAADVAKAAEAVRRFERDALRAAHAKDTSGEASVADFYAMESSGYDPADAARAATKAQELYNDEVRKSAAEAQKWGEAIGSVVGILADREMEAGQKMAQIGQMVISTVVQAAIAQITANAATAASGAAASQAGIPVVGPILAISAMGAMLSAVMGLLAEVPSARGGWDVPAGYNGLAMIHEREMVLPQEQADIIRSGGGGGITVNVGGAIISDRDLEQTLTSRNGGLARAQRKMQRRRRG